MVHLLKQIRPIDKKLQYQIQKLMRVADITASNEGVNEEEADASKKSEDLLKYRPNPDMLVSKTDMDSEVLRLVIIRSANFYVMSINIATKGSCRPSVNALFVYYRIMMESIAPLNLPLL